MSVRIADLPGHDRPRERLLRCGPGALSDRELLALVLCSGRPGESALDLADALLFEHGGLSGLASARPEELAARAGVGPAKAAAVVAALRLGSLVAGQPEGDVLRSAQDVARVAAQELGGARVETVLVLVCDGANRLRRSVPVALGSVDRSCMPVREVLNAVLRHDGRAFAVAHNHPSGDPTPSDWDRQATDVLAAGARTVGLRFLDHVVIGTGGGWESATPRPRTPSSGSKALGQRHAAP